MHLVNLVSYKHSLTMVQLGVLSATKKINYKIRFIVCLGRPLYIFRKVN